jgi:hypothetical protein
VSHTSHVLICPDSRTLKTGLSGPLARLWFPKILRKAAEISSVRGIGRADPRSKVNALRNRPLTPRIHGGKSGGRPPEAAEGTRKPQRSGGPRIDGSPRHYLSETLNVTMGDHARRHFPSLRVSAEAAGEHAPGVPATRPPWRRRGGVRNAVGRRASGLRWRAGAGRPDGSGRAQQRPARISDSGSRDRYASCAPVRYAGD